MLTSPQDPKGKKLTKLEKDLLKVLTDLHIYTKEYVHMSAGRLDMRMKVDEALLRSANLLKSFLTAKPKKAV